MINNIKFCNFLQIEKKSFRILYIHLHSNCISPMKEAAPFEAASEKKTTTTNTPYSQKQSVPFNKGTDCKF